MLESPAQCLCIYISLWLGSELLPKTCTTKNVSLIGNGWGMFDMALWARQSGSTVYVAEPYGSVKAFKPSKQIVTIFGANLGTSSPATLQDSETGLAPTSLADTEVWFDNVPAPLIYVSSTQVSALAPSTFSAATTNLQVIYRGQSSNTLTIPVVAAVPGLFSFDGMGGGLGIINADGTQNDWESPAAPGSMVTFYATGCGQTVPAIPDGLSTSLGRAAVPLLPLTVLIDGKPAEVSYAGPAAGKVSGIVQVNVRVPNDVTGYDLSVQLRAGEYQSANMLNISVQ